MATSSRAKSIGQLFLGSLVVAALILRDSILVRMNDFYTWINPLSHVLREQAAWIPPDISVYVVISAGLFLLAAAVVLPPALLGVRRAWIVVGLVFMGLQLAAWYLAITHTRLGPEKPLEYLSSLAPVFLYSLGSLAGAAVSEWAVLKFGGHTPSKRGKKGSKKGASH